MNDLTYLLQPAYGWNAPWDTSDLLGRIHADAEATWHNSTKAGSGTWEGQAGSTTSPPYIRMITARARAYLTAPANDLFRDRVHQACDYLVSVQQPDGRWESTSTTGAGSTIDDAFDTAEVGWLLSEAFGAFGIPAYLTAAIKAAQWQIAGTVTAQYADPEYYAAHPTDSPLKQLMGFQNANFTGSILRHLSAVLPLVTDLMLRDSIRQAIREAAVALNSWLLQTDGICGTWQHYGDYPSGLLGGSNVKAMTYHDLSVSGLLAALPHMATTVSLEPNIYRAINYAIRQQQATGLTLYRPDGTATGPYGGWAVADGLRMTVRNPVNQFRGAIFLFALGKACDGLNWQGTGKMMMEQRMVLLRFIAAYQRWQAWWEGR